jgi:hypothetical protein
MQMKHEYNGLVLNKFLYYISTNSLEIHFVLSFGAIIYIYFSFKIILCFHSNSLFYALFFWRWGNCVLLLIYNVVARSIWNRAELNFHFFLKFFIASIYLLICCKYCASECQESAKHTHKQAQLAIRQAPLRAIKHFNSTQPRVSFFFCYLCCLSVLNSLETNFELFV